jgi:hypothetical protein
MASIFPSPILIIAQKRNIEYFQHYYFNSRNIMNIVKVITRLEGMPMKNFCTLEQAKKGLQVYLDYINLIEQYEPTNFVHCVIKEYALEGNIIRTADILNRRGFRIENRAIEPQDITQVIISTPDHDDALHKEIRRLYLKKTNSKRVCSKPYVYR